MDTREVPVLQINLRKKGHLSNTEPSHPRSRECVWSGFLSAFLPLLVIWGSPPWFHIFHILTIFIWLHILHCVAALNRVSFHYAIFLFCLFIGEMIVLPVTFGERMTLSTRITNLEASSALLPLPPEDAYLSGEESGRVLMKFLKALYPVVTF